MPTPKHTDLASFMEDFLGTTHLEALSLLAQSLSEENRARPMTVSKEMVRHNNNDLLIARCANERKRKKKRIYLYMCVCVLGDREKDGVGN